MTETQLTFDDLLDEMWPDSAIGREARRAIRRISERGGASYYGEAHLAARWHLGFFEPAPVKYAQCPATELTVAGLVNGIHAALDWERAPVERLRRDSRGLIFSIAPDLDYIPLCRSCHRRYDTWQKALLGGVRPAPMVTAGPIAV